MAENILTVGRPEGSTLVRIHRRHRAALHFNRSPEGRFNAQAEEFGVCYFGDTLACAFLETLVRGSNFRVIPRKALEGGIGGICGRQLGIIGGPAGSTELGAFAGGNWV